MKRIIFIPFLIIIGLLIIPSSAGAGSIHQYSCKVIEFYPYEKQTAFGGHDSVSIHTSKCAAMIFELSMRGTTFKKGFSKEIRDKVKATFADGTVKTARSVRLKDIVGNSVSEGTYKATACFGRQDFPIVKVECDKS